MKRFCKIQIWKKCVGGGVIGLSRDRMFSLAGGPKDLDDLSRKELQVYEDIRKAGRGGLLRLLMDREEITIANSLVKKGLVEKGLSDDNRGTVIYHVA